MTRKDLLPLFCIRTSYLSHGDCLVVHVIVKLYTVPMFLHRKICAVRNFVNQKAFTSKHMSTFLPQNYDVNFQIRQRYAKGPFCVTWLIRSYGRGGSREVKLLACRARGLVFNSWSRHMNFRDWVSPASKLGYD